MKNCVSALCLLASTVLGHGKNLQVSQNAVSWLDTTRSTERQVGFLAMRAFSACCYFSLLGRMLFGNLQPQNASDLAWAMVQAGAALLTSGVFRLRGQG